MTATMEATDLATARRIMRELESRHADAEAQLHAARLNAAGSAMTAIKQRIAACDDLLEAQRIIVARAECDAEEQAIRDAECARDAAFSDLDAARDRAAQVATLMEAANTEFGHALTAHTFAEHNVNMGKERLAQARQRLAALTAVPTNP